MVVFEPWLSQFIHLSFNNFLVLFLDTIKWSSFFTPQPYKYCTIFVCYFFFSLVSLHFRLFCSWLHYYYYYIYDDCLWQCRQFCYTLILCIYMCMLFFPAKFKLIIPWLTFICISRRQINSCRFTNKEDMKRHTSTIICFLCLWICQKKKCARYEWENDQINDGEALMCVPLLCRFFFVRSFLVSSANYIEITAV